MEAIADSVTRRTDGHVPARAHQNMRRPSTWPSELLAFVSDVDRTNINHYSVSDTNLLLSIS